MPSSTSLSKSFVDARDSGPSVQVMSWRTLRALSSRRLIAGLFGMAAVIASPLSQAFVEDICITPNGAVENFYLDASIQSVPECGYGKYFPRCVYKVIKRGTDTFGETSICRGIIHFEAVYFTAQAVGFSGEMAYFVAAFSQAIDFTQYRALDSCGNDLPLRYWTPPLRGLLRTSTVSGGSIRHLGVPYGDHIGSTDALVPNWRALQEGTLSQARSWAFGKSDLLCHGGFTQSVDEGNPFSGSKCASGGQLNSDVSKLVSGPIPLSGGVTKLGPQILHFDCEPDCWCSNSCGDGTPPLTPRNVLRAEGGNFGEYLSQGPFARLENGDPVPELIARLGIFMHWISDRASHASCTNSEKSRVTGPDENGDYLITLDTYRCNAITHGMEHYWEQGMGDETTPGSEAALRLYYQELQEFVNEQRDKNPSWFRAELTPLPFEYVVGTQARPGITLKATLEKDARKRVGIIVDALKDQSLMAIPGFETFCNQ